MMSEIRLLTDAWHSDREITLTVPEHWEAIIHTPDTPSPLTDVEITRALAQPVGAAAIRRLCVGKTRPLIIIDDLNRPTPTHRLLPFLLNELTAGGVRPGSVGILLATGTHGPPTLEAINRKVGPEAASSCRIVVHNPERGCRYIGTTKAGTPVLVNPEVLASDFVLGIGGIYPNHTAGFGGGSKLALGVLGMRSIMRLHYTHPGVGWGQTECHNSVRKDLDEIAGMIKLQTMISVHVNLRREIVRMVCGDHFRFYEQEMQYAQPMFSAPAPEGADVIVSNAYPGDLSLTFALMKGMVPLRDAPPGVSRIVVASCRDGIGFHGLFPLQRRHNMAVHALRLLTTIGPAGILKKAAGRIQRRNQAVQRNPAWLFQPIEAVKRLPVPGGVKLATSWPDILDAVAKEQSGKRKLKVMVYTCAPLQCLTVPMPADLCAEKKNNLVLTNK